VLGLAATGCGGTKTVATTAPLPPGVKRYVPAPAPKQISYSVSLAPTKGVPPGLPAGAPNASGLLAISLEPSRGELCWRFSELKNVPTPTVAHLFEYEQGGSGEGGFPLGRRYTPAGCVHKIFAVFTLLEAHPERFWVSIHSAKFPAGAVRGQLGHL
jgi:CHRD domain